MIHIVCHFNFKEKSLGLKSLIEFFEKKMNLEIVTTVTTRCLMII